MMGLALTVELGDLADIIMFTENFMHSVLLIFRPRFDLITGRLNQLLQLTANQQMDIYSLPEDFNHFTSND